MWSSVCCCVFYMCKHTSWCMLYMYLLYIYVVHWKHMLISTFCDKCEKLLLNKNQRLIERYETIPSTCYAQMLLPHMSHVTVEIQMFLLSGMLPERCYSCKLLQIPHHERIRCLEVLWCLENKTASQLPMFEREKSMSWFRLPNLFHPDICCHTGLLMTGIATRNGRAVTCKNTLYILSVNHPSWGSFPVHPRI